MNPKIVDREARRRNICQAAMELYARKGTARTTIQEIAEQAGIGKGTIYEYFDSKESILAAVFDYVREDSEIVINAALEDTSDPREKLVNFFDGFTRYFGDFPEDLTEILLVIWAEGILHKSEENSENNSPFDLRSMYLEYNQILMDILDEGQAKGVFRTCLDSAALSPALIGAIDGIMLQHVLLKDTIDFDASVQALIKSVLRGIEVQE